MKWENLKSKNCPFPYCEKPMQEPKDGLWQCSNCKFKTEEYRAKRIIQHRADPSRIGIIRYRWQNLRQGKCPVCAEDLMNAPGPYELVKCVRPECTFKIREDSMQTILKDPQHPANRCTN